jgi:hypothetical protein
VGVPIPLSLSQQVPFSPKSLDSFKTRTEPRDKLANVTAPEPLTENKHVTHHFLPFNGSPLFPYVLVEAEDPGLRGRRSRRKNLVLYLDSCGKKSAKSGGLSSHEALGQCRHHTRLSLRRHCKGRGHLWRCCWTFCSLHDEGHDDSLVGLGSKAGASRTLRLKENVPCSHLLG